MTKRLKDTSNTTVSWNYDPFMNIDFFDSKGTTLTYHRLINEVTGKLVDRQYLSYDSARKHAEDKSSRDGGSYLIVEVMGEVRSQITTAYTPVHTEYEIV